MKNILQYVILNVLLLTAGYVFAATPVFTITPSQLAPAIIYSGQTATAIYQITNNTPFALNGSGLANLPVGLTQSGGTCGNPINLAAGASCTVNLLITADQLQGNILGGPKVCNTVANPIYCSLPSPEDELNIVKSSSSAPMPTLSVTSPTTNQTLEANNTATISITVKNTSNSKASNVQMSSSWTGVTFTPTSCGNIAAGSTCTFTVKASTPNIAGKISIQGSNTNTVTTPYVAFTLNGYLVFAVDAGTTTAKLLYSSDVSSSISWDSSVTCSLGTCTLTNASSLNDGAYLDSTGNTYMIISGTNAIGTQSSTGGNAAASCYNITSDNSGTVPNGTWYLPAICEMGGSGQGAGCASGVANIDANLFQLGYGPVTSGSYYWSSTEYSSNDADHELFETNGASVQGDDDKYFGFHAICVKSVTY